MAGILLCVLAFTGVFYPVSFLDIQGIPAVARWRTGVVTAGFFVLALCLVTALFGRVYCSILCPLGWVQDGLMFLWRRHNIPHRPSRFYNLLLAVVLFGTCIGGTVVFIRWIDPYTVFGAAVSGTIYGLLFLTGLAGLVAWKGRLFCTHICPVGAVLGLITKKALYQMQIDAQKCIMCAACARVCPTGSIDVRTKTVNNETCIRCFKCLNGCARNSLFFGRRPAQPVPFNPDRRQWLKTGVVVGLFMVSVKAGWVWAQAMASSVKKRIVPPGAGSAEKLADRCLNCNLCVQNCPMHIIKKADDVYPAVHIDFNGRYCRFDCHRCSDVCPAGALKRMTLAQKQKTQIGLAEIDPQICVKCGRCVNVCPKEAVSRKRRAFPVVDEQKCIGCGLCQSVCPVQAIQIAAVQEQTIQGG